MKELTAIQSATVDYIKSFTYSHGFPPSHHEMADHFGVTSRAIFDRLTLIRKKGYIESEPYKARTLKVKEGIYETD
jgi:repressor LexA